MDKKHVGIEKRGFPRIEISLFIFYRLKNEDAFIMHKAISQNISGGGLMFEANKTVPAGSILHLEIYQPSVKYKDLFFLLSVQAKVIWANKKEGIGKSEGTDKYQIGVEFVEIEKEDRNKIIEYAERVKQGW